MYLEKYCTNWIFRSQSKVAIVTIKILFCSSVFLMCMGCKLFQSFKQSLAEISQSDILENTFTDKNALQLKVSCFLIYYKSLLDWHYVRSKTLTNFAYILV